MDDRRVFEPLGTYKLSVYPLLLVSFIYGAANRPASPLLAIASNLRPPVICDSTGIFGVSVTPPPGSATWDPNTGGHTASFTVTNTGQCTDIYSFSYTHGAPISGVTFNPTTLHLSAGAHGTVTATYGVGNTASGWLTVTATGSFGVQGSGSYFVTATAGPVVSTSPTNGDYIDVSKCVENCFDAVASYATPPYVSGDVPRFVQLNYRSAQAHPMGVVQVDAVDTSSIKPRKMSIQLYTSQSTLVTFTNNSTEIFYDSTSHPADGNVIRLAAQFDASNLTTGSYNYTVVVRSYRPDGTFRETHQPIRILIVNEANSPFGAGWSMGGFQRAYLQGDGGVAITEGNGSLAYFARGTTSCNQYGCTIHYISPKGDFSTVFRDSADTCGFPSSCPTYMREYPTGSIVAFDSSLNTKWIGGLLGVFGKMTTFTYNANLLVGITDSIGKTITLGYASNHLGWIKDPGGRFDSVTVDGSGNLSRIKDWATTNNQGGQPLTFQYDASHRLVHWTDRRGGAWGLSYDFAGKLGADTAPQVTINGLSLRPVKAFASVEQKVLVNPSSGQGSSSNPAPNVDTAVVRATLTNPRGYTTKYALNRFGAATLLQEPLGRTTVFTRDSNSAIVRNVSPSGHVMKYTWTGPDLIQRLDSTTGRTITYGYSYYAFAHDLVLVSGQVDSLVNVWYNGSLDSSHTGGAGWTKYTYASGGRLCGVVDPGGHTDTCYFATGSGFQNTDSIMHTLGTVGYRYDGHGQPVMSIDEVSDTNKTLYDSIGRPSAAIGPLHDTTSFTYDGLYLTQVRDAKGQVYKYWPNALGWVDSTTDPTGKVDRYQYDPNGNRTSWTNRSGQTVTFTYDSLDQARSEVADGKTTTFFSDPAGRYRVASNSESVDTLKFDSADRPSLAISCRVLVNGNAPQCFRDSSAYEIRDARISATLSAPSVWSTTQVIVGHHYDIHQTLDTLTPGHLSTQSAQPITFVYSVESLDSIRTLTGLNNLTITHSYPWTHRTDQVQLSDPTLTAALGTAENFDNAKRVLTRYHGSLANPDTTRSFSYDLQADLKRYSDTAHHYTTSCTWFKSGYYCSGTDQPVFIGSTTYTYDSVGNRTDLLAPSGGLDPGNRLRRWQTFRMDYNAVGSMTAKRTLSTIDTTKVLRTDSLFWSAAGRLDSVRTRDSLGSLTGRVGYGYDGWGRRVRKSTANGTSRYLWDGDSLLAQLDTLGALLAEYSYYPGMDNVASVLRHDRADTTYYYIQDNSRNVLALLARTSSGNTIDNQYRYEPFGNVQGSGIASVPNALQFAGREYDVETQLYYDRARYIDPTVGRFISEDPIGLHGGINPYRFVGNDPVNRWDPSGHCQVFKEPVGFALEHLAIGTALAVIGNAANQPPGIPVAWAFFVGWIHEGPWWDGDLSDPKSGAPCAGILDIGLFMLPPIINIFLQNFDPGPYTGWYLGHGPFSRTDPFDRRSPYSPFGPGFPQVPHGWVLCSDWSGSC